MPSETDAFFHDGHDASDRERVTIDATIFIALKYLKYECQCACLS
jgi:hypothetical protein